MIKAFIIRPAQPGDATAIAALTRKAYTPWIALTGREPLPMRVDYGAAMQAHDFALIESGQELIALIETTPEGDALLIVNVAVEPSSQGQGLGRQLMAYAETLARSCGLMRTRLYTNKLFARNLRLYALIGYEVDREEDVNGGTAVHMMKRLS